MSLKPTKSRKTKCVDWEWDVFVCYTGQNDYLDYAIERMAAWYRRRFVGKGFDLEQGVRDLQFTFKYKEEAREFSSEIKRYFRVRTSIKKNDAARQYLCTTA